MNIVTGITDQPNQQFDLQIADGSRVKVTLNFRVQQLGWFLDLVWTRTDGTTFPLYGLRVTTSPNILRQWRNLLPFGLAVITSANGEPVSVKSFSSNTSQLVLLDEADVELIESQVYTGL